jgi:hypothetical protein
MLILAGLLGCGSPAAEPATGDATPFPGNDDVELTAGDSLRLTLVVPADAAAGAAVPVTLTVENVSGRRLDLYLRGRTVTFDIVVSDAAGTTVWRRLEGEVIPAVLRLEPLQAGQVLEMRDTWDQRDNAGQSVGAGDYHVRGEVLTEGAPLVSHAAPLRIAAP